MFLHESEDSPHKSGIKTKLASSKSFGLKSEDSPHKSGIKTPFSPQVRVLGLSEDSPHKSGIKTVGCLAPGVILLVGRLAPQIGD